MAQSSASFWGLSISEARTAASAFVATGQIYGDNVQKVTVFSKEFARALDVDFSKAVEKMAKDLQKPSDAALEWNKTLGFLDENTLKHIRTLEMSGDKQGAIKALIDAATPSVQRMAAIIPPCTTS